MSCALVGRRPGGGAGTGAFFAGRAAWSGLARGGAGFAAAVAAAPPSAAPLGAGADGADTPPVVSMAARSRRATGASIVLDADLTYSPIS
jgi:hypothetical protein